MIVSMFQSALTSSDKTSKSFCMSLITFENSIYVYLDIFASVMSPMKPFCSNEALANRYWDAIWLLLLNYYHKWWNVWPFDVQQETRNTPLLYSVICCLWSQERIFQIGVGSLNISKSMIHFNKMIILIEVYPALLDLFGAIWSW